jgi:hypothetical protein
MDPQRRIKRQRAGVLLRRTLPAMAVTLAVFVAIQVLVPALVRPHLVPPVQTTRTPSAAQLGTIFTNRDGDFVFRVTAISGQPGAWIIGNSWVGAAGQRVTRLPAACVTASRSSSAGALPSCLARHDVKAVVSYQPASRYWEMQSAETAIYLVLAVGLGGLCYWAVRRRQRAA